MSLKNNAQNILLLIKLVRIRRTFLKMNISKTVNWIKEQIKNHILKKIQNNIRQMKPEDRATDNGMGGLNLKEDNNLIGLLLVITTLLRTLKLFFFILSFSYLSAVVFRIILTIEVDLWGTDQSYLEGDCSSDPAGGFFARCYDLEIDDSNASEDDLSKHSGDFIVLTYFTFTTLSTVGFGDYNPKSNVERMFIGFFMLFGVATFSYIMGNFIDILNKFKELNADLDDGIELAKFFGILKTFNRQADFNVPLKKKIEKFFDFRWQRDKNFVMDSDEFASIV